MARFLLDGRNRQPCRDTVKRFRRVSRGCKELVFKIIEQGTAFNHADQFIEEACNRVVEKLVLNSSSSA
jgi:hypothetical protein